MTRDWTALAFSSMEDITAAAAADLTEDLNLAPITAMIRHRTLYLLRSASRRQIIEEALSLEKFLYSDPAKSIPDFDELKGSYGAWRELADLLAEAARRSDVGAIPSILRQHTAVAQLLPLIGSEREGVPLDDINFTLKIPISEQSHMMHDLSEADIIEIYPAEEGPYGNKMMVKLGSRGNEAIKLMTSL